MALVDCRDLLQKDNASLSQEFRWRHRILRCLTAMFLRSERDWRDDQRGRIELPNVVLQNDDRTAAVLHRNFFFFSQIAKKRYFPPDA